MQKTLEVYFADWEGQVFGFGYGSGEYPVLGALRSFFELMEQPHGQWSYDHVKLEAALGETTTWLLINILGHADIIEYGTSPRYAWLTAKGRKLREFMLSHSLDDLCWMTQRKDDPCYPDHCNCDREKNESRCVNPFWT